MIVEMERIPRRRQCRSSMSRTPRRLRRKPPRFGAANREVLAEAGYSRAEIDALIAAGIVVETMRKAPED